MEYQDMTYEQLKNIDLPKWEDLTKDDLGKLFNNPELTKSIIADLFGVEHRDVIAKLNHYNLKNYYCYAKYPRKEMQEDNREAFLHKSLRQEIVNEIAAYLTTSAIDTYNISNGDYSSICKDMVSRIGGIIEAAEQGEWTQLSYFLKKYKRSVQFEISPKGKEIIDSEYFKFTEEGRGLE